MALTQSHSRIQRFNAWLQSPEDGACLAVFRILFGLAMAWDAGRYIFHGWAWSIYSEPFLFKYFGFEWVAPLAPIGMLAVYVGMVVAGVMIAAGAFYRVATTYFFLAHTYVFLLSASHYLNHAYLISVFAFMLIWLPANRCFAIDAWRREELRELPTPRWCRFALHAQIAIVYFFGAIAKLNPDWLAGVPITQWMGYSAERNPWAADLITAPTSISVIMWGGILFDLLIVPALLWRRTRAIAFVVSIGFHMSNAVLFEIGIFPWMMLGATTVFFAADWPRRVPGLRKLFEDWQPVTTPVSSGLRLIVVPLSLWMALQIAMPLRHHLYPDDVAWTEEGHLFSWRMKLRSKRGRVTYRVRDPETGDEWRVFPEKELTDRQARKMAGRPELILQYAHHIADIESERLGHRVEVRADAFVSLNYRAPERFIDRDRDLAATKASLRHYDWILPFEWTPAPLPEASESPIE